MHVVTSFKLSGCGDILITVHQSIIPIIIEKNSERREMIEVIEGAHKKE